MQNRVFFFFFFHDSVFFLSETMPFKRFGAPSPQLEQPETHLCVFMFFIYDTGIIHSLMLGFGATACSVASRLSGAIPDICDAQIFAQNEIVKGTEYKILKSSMYQICQFCV